MRLSTSLVAVKKIVSSIPSSDFDSGQIEQLAQQILKAEGIVNPLVLRRDSLESYEVVDGYFEYYAAVRARELDPRKGEMISAYIIEPENDDVRSAIEEQIKLLRESRSTSTDRIIDSDQKTEISKSILAKLNAFEYRINAFENSLQEKIEGINKVDYTKLSSDEIDTIGNKLGDKLAAVIKASEKSLLEKIEEIKKVDYTKLSSDEIDIIGNKLGDKLTVIIKESLEKIKSGRKLPKKVEYDKDKGEKVLQELNTFEESQIKQKLSDAGIRTAKSLAKKIYQSRSESYTSIEDIMNKVEGLHSGTTIEKIIKNW